MDAIDRIASSDWPAFETWARVHGLSLDDAAESFEDAYLGEWPNLTRFAYDRAQWEHGLPDRLVPFLDVHAYIEWLFGPDGAFMSIGSGPVVWVFQTAEEPIKVGPVVPIRMEADPE